jgi:hypothetical protein
VKNVYARLGLSLLGLGAAASVYSAAALRLILKARRAADAEKRREAEAQDRMDAEKRAQEADAEASKRFDEGMAAIMGYAVNGKTGFEQ